MANFCLTLTFWGHIGSHLSDCYIYIEVSNDFDIPRLLEAALLPRRQFFRITNIPMDKSLKLQDLREEITWL